MSYSEKTVVGFMKCTLFTIKYMVLLYHCVIVLRYCYCVFVLFAMCVVGITCPEGTPSGV